MRIRQIVFAAQHLAASRDLLAGVLQLPAPFRDPGVAEFGLDNAVFTFGDQFIEVISPTRPDTACGRHLARLGDGGYMLILQTDDLARERARFDALGVRRVWQADLADISAMHLHPKDIGGAIVSIDEPRPAASWRWGGPDWRVQAGDAGRQRVLGLTLHAREPEALARRWAQVLGLAAPQPLGGDQPNEQAEGQAGRQGRAWRLALSEGFADFQPAPGGQDAVAGFTLAVADPAAVCARARAAGLAVDGTRLQLLGASCSLVPLGQGVAPGPVSP